MVKRAPAPVPAPFGEAAGLEGTGASSPQAASPGRGWGLAPATRSLGGIAHPAGLSGVSLVLPCKVSINGQPGLQTADSLHCGFW